MFRKTLMASSFLAFTLAAGTASSAGGYAGVSVGQSFFPDDFEDDISFALTGGYRINQNFAVEGSYLHLGEAEYDDVSAVTLEATGFNVAAVGIFPVNESVELFGKLGMFMWDLELDGGGYIGNAEDDGTDISLGIGANYHLSEEFDLVAEYQRFDLDDEDISNLSIGARFKF